MSNGVVVSQKKHYDEEHWLFSVPYHHSGQLEGVGLWAVLTERHWLAVAVAGVSVFVAVILSLHLLYLAQPPLTPGYHVVSQKEQDYPLLLVQYH